MVGCFRGGAGKSGMINNSLIIHCRQGDIYSFGMLLYHILFRRQPYETNNLTAKGIFKKQIWIIIALVLEVIEEVKQKGIKPDVTDALAEEKPVTFNECVNISFVVNWHNGPMLVKDAGESAQTSNSQPNNFKHFWVVKRQSYWPNA